RQRGGSGKPRQQLKGLLWFDEESTPTVLSRSIRREASTPTPVPTGSAVSGCASRLRANTAEPSVTYRSTAHEALRRTGRVVADHGGGGRVWGRSLGI